MEQAMAQGLNAIVCIGEKLEEKDESKTDEVIHRQLTAIKGTIRDFLQIYRQGGKLGQSCAGL